MMVEPPGDFGRAGILKVHDGILVAVEILFIEQSSGAMQQSGENEMDIATNALAIETGKQCRRTRPVKATIMKENTNLQTNAPELRNRIQQRISNEGESKEALSGRVRRRPVSRQDPQ